MACRDHVLFADTKQNVIGAACAPSNNAYWNGLLDGTHTDIHDTVASIDFEKLDQAGSRGDYSVYTSGLGAGNGRLVRSLLPVPDFCLPRIDANSNSTAT